MDGRLNRYRNRYRPIAVLCVIGLLIGLLFSEKAPARAVTEMEFSKTTVRVFVGQEKKVQVNGEYSKIKAVSKNPDYAAVAVRKNKQRVVIQGVSGGAVDVRVRGYDESGTLTARGTIHVKVREEPVREPVDLMAEYSPDSIHSGEATFYDADEGGGGAACLDGFGGDYYTAAMNSEDYLNGLAGAYIEVTDKDGDVVNVLITDLLPEGKKGDIDLDRRAFKSIEPPVTGRMAVTWRVIALPTEEPVSFLWKPTSSRYWAQVQVRNHRYPIRSLEVWEPDTGEFRELERKDYNYFEAPDGMGGKGPFTFRITDFYGRSIVEENIAMKTGGKAVTGTQNFPLWENEL